MCRYNDMRLCCTLLQMLRRYWGAYPEERADAPEETAERIMVFQRGAEVVSVVCGGWDIVEKVRSFNARHKGRLIVSWCSSAAQRW